jgi:putative sigma-54 modulation protein
MNHAKELTFEENFHIKVMAKNIELTKPIEDYVLEKTAKLDKFSTHKINMTVSLEVQKLSHIVDVVFHFSHFQVKVHAETDNLYSAIDRAFDKLSSKLRRWKSRIQDHHAKGLKVIDMQVNVFDVPQIDEVDEYNEEIEEQRLAEMEKALQVPSVVKETTRPLKTLRSDEAVMKLELSGDNFLIYTSEEDHKLKIMYRRSKGYGIISPSA